MNPSIPFEPYQPADYIKKPVPFHAEETFKDIYQIYVPRAIQEVKRIAPLFRSKNQVEIARKIFTFCKTYIKYREDEMGFEEIKLPNRLLSDKYGDCEDFTILGSAILSVLKITHTLRMADYGNGWQHIYIKIGETTLDPVQEHFNLEDQGIFLDHLVSFQGLGKLANNLYTERERFLINLWKMFQEDGVLYQEATKVNTLPTPSVKALVPYIEKAFPLQVLYLPEEEKQLLVERNKTKTIHLAERLKITLENGSDVTFDPEMLASLAIKIAGNDILKAPLLPKEGINPQNTNLMNLFKDFVLAKADKNQTIFKGVNFSSQGVAASNTMSLLWLDKASQEQGTFLFNSQEISTDVRDFPDYPKVIQKNAEHPIQLQCAYESFEASFRVALERADNESKNIKPIFLLSDEMAYYYQINSENHSNESEYRSKLLNKQPFPSFIFAFDGNLFSKILKLMKNQKVSNFSLGIGKAKDPMVIKFSSTWGDFVYLQMPIEMPPNTRFKLIYRKKEQELLRNNLGHFAQALYQL